MPPPAAPTDPCTALDSLFPAGAASVLSLAPGVAGELTAAEAQCARTFAPARVAEFRHGRACARHALARLGEPPADITIGANREPVWPRGIVGSISHAGPAAAAVVAREAQFLSLGLDIESAGPLEPGLGARICLPVELRRCAASGEPAGCAEKLVFSIKEAAYKALWPRLGRFLDFHDLEVMVDDRRGHFTVASRSALCPPRLAAAIVGRFTRCDELIAAGAAIIAGPRP